MYVVRPSVVRILVLPRRSPRVATLLRFWHTLLSVSLDLKINLCRVLHVLLVPAEAETSMASGLEGASHCIRCFIRAGPFVLDAFPRWSGLVFHRLHCVLASSSLLHSKSSISSTSSRAIHLFHVYKRHVRWEGTSQRHKSACDTLMLLNSKKNSPVAAGWNPFFFLI